MPKARAHVLVSGMVQGVFFRSYTCDQAKSLMINGWVRNLWDGRVEALFEGEEEAVKSMVDWCRKGPSSAVVKDVEVRWEDYKAEFQGFSIKY